MMKSMHAGPSSYRPDNQSRRPGKGRTGSVERVSKKRGLGHPHERRGKSAPKGRGFGKIATTGKPRFTRFSTF